MDIANSEIDKLLMDKRELQDSIRQIDHKLCNFVSRFDGKLIDALKIGLVRLNFAAPAGFMRHLRETK